MNAITRLTADFEELAEDAQASFAALQDELGRVYSRVDDLSIAGWARRDIGNDDLALADYRARMDAARIALLVPRLIDLTRQMPTYFEIVKADKLRQEAAESLTAAHNAVELALKCAVRDGDGVGAAAALRAMHSAAALLAGAAS